MTTMLVIDTTARHLAVFTANVTRAEAGLVVRPALSLPSLAYFAKGATWRSPKDTGGLPVLLLGDGYTAQSSAGFVSVTARWGLPGTAVPVVGWLGDHGLRYVRPRLARLFGPVRLVEEKSFSNSNYNTASAVLAGLPLLVTADPRAIVIAEGQSDRVGVWRLLPTDPRAESIDLLRLEEVDEDHRAERFTRTACVAAAARAAYMAYRRRCLEAGGFAAYHQDGARQLAAVALAACAHLVGWQSTEEVDELHVLDAALAGLPGAEVVVES